MFHTLLQIAEDLDVGEYNILDFNAICAGVNHPWSTRYRTHLDATTDVRTDLEHVTLMVDQETTQTRSDNQFRIGFVDTAGLEDGLMHEDGMHGQRDEDRAIDHLHICKRPVHQVRVVLQQTGAKEDLIPVDCY